MATSLASSSRILGFARFGERGQAGQLLGHGLGGLQEGQFALEGLLHDHARHQHAVDLVGALEDAVDALVAVQPLQRILLAVAVAAEHLQALLGGQGAGLGGEDLDHRALDAELLDLLDAGSRS